MNNKKGLISPYAFMYTIACFVQCSALVVGYISSVVKQDTWICIIIGFFAALPVILIFIKLGEKFPSKDIIEINEIVFGKILGKIISVTYAFFFLTLTVLNLEVMENFVKYLILPETPSVLIFGGFILACGYAVHKGIENITKYGALFTAIVMFVVVITTFFLIGKMKIENLFPMFDLPFKKYVQAIHGIIALPFADIVVFMMLFPHLKEPKNIKKPFILGTAIGTVLILLIAMRNIMTLGPILGKFAIPGFETVRLIRVGEIIQRMEVLYAVILLLLFFYKVSILYFSTVKSVSRLFSTHSYKMFVPVFGTIIVFMSLIAFNSAAENAVSATTIAPIYQTFMEIVLPLATLITASIRGLGENKNVELNQQNSIGEVNK